MAEASTANVALRDSMVRHQIQLQRLASGIAKQIRDVLNASEEDIARIIRERLANFSGLDSPADVRRMQTVLRMLTNLRETTFDQADEVWAQQLTALATTEPTLLAHQLDVTSPVILDIALPAVSQLKAIVTSQPFEGATLKEWSKKLRADDIRRMASQIQLGMVAGEDAATIARRIVGTAQLLGKDGVTEITRRNAEAISRTAVNFISNRARRQLLLSNKLLFTEELFVAVLDSRTTPLCRSLDGNVYEVGEGPIPPLHWNCRSLRVFVFNGKAIGNRPMKASTQQQLLREFGKKHGMIFSSRDDIPRGLKTEFDAFARQRVRELTGTVPAATNYQDWLTSQPAQFQDDILGKTKGKLFRDGGLTLDKFVSTAGDELTLSELAQKQAQAFRATGLDPGDYL